VYLHELYIWNDGPVSDLYLDLPLRDGVPKPILLIGENGSGKTNVLSIIADALIEGAAAHHQDVVADSVGTSRPWFRVVGGDVTRRGSSGTFTLARFVDGGKSLVYRQKAGQVPTEALEGLSDTLKPHATWAASANLKHFELTEDDSRRIYSEGCYLYFPAGRSEVPHWLNEGSLRTDYFESPRRYVGHLGKMMYVERGIQEISRWVPSLILDTRVFRVVNSQIVNEGNSAAASGAEANRRILDLILKQVLGDDTAIFYWGDRRKGLGIYSQNLGAFVGLSALSSGQATLLTIFGTILMQCDLANMTASEFEGVCVIDEIDAHLHIDLAFNAIPGLLALFPRIQFILSAHSPLFVLGMRAKYGDDGMRLIEMPSGRTVDAEAFVEFQRALDVLSKTQAFDDILVRRLSETGQPLILCEGKTDPTYIRTAAELLGRTAWLDGVQLDFIGTDNESGGGSHGSGKANLSQARKLLQNNPGLLNGPVLLLFDNDANQRDGDGSLVSVRSIPTNVSNTEFTKGIENLLDPDVLTADMIKTSVKEEGNGRKVIVEQLDKAALCRYLCEVKRDPSDFVGFEPVIGLLEEWVAAVKVRNDVPTAETGSPDPPGELAEDRTAAERGPDRRHGERSEPS
jgi:hypothetical protein